MQPTRSAKVSRVRSFLGQRLIVEFSGCHRVKREIELVFPPEIESSFGESIVTVLHESIRRNPRTEAAMLLVGRATWRSPTPVLGFAYARRTWCHHLVVDFLSAHPRVIHGKPERIRGVGSGLVKQLIAVAEAMEIRCVWGEATAHSAPFYERALNVEEILDHFFIEDEVMRYCLDELRKAREQMLARRAAK